MTEQFVNIKVFGLIILLSSHSLVAENDTVFANETVTKKPGMLQDNVEILDSGTDSISNANNVKDTAFDDAVTEVQEKHEESMVSFRNNLRRPTKQESPRDDVGISNFLTKQFDVLCNIVGMPC